MRQGSTHKLEGMLLMVFMGGGGGGWKGGVHF